LKTSRHFDADVIGSNFAMVKLQPTSLYEALLRAARLLISHGELLGNVAERTQGFELQLIRSKKKI